MSLFLPKNKVSTWLLTTVFLLISSALFAQSSYDSEFHKRVLSNPAEASPQELLVVRSPEASEVEVDLLNQLVDEAVAHLERKKFAKKSPNKQWLLLSKLAYLKRLKAPVYEGSFTTFITMGECDDITYVGILAIILDRMNVPYEIRKTEEGFRAFIYPAGENLKLNSYAPNIIDGSTISFTDHEEFLEILQYNGYVDWSSFKGLSYEKAHAKIYADKEGAYTYEEMLYEGFYRDAHQFFVRDEYVEARSRIYAIENLGTSPKAKLLEFATYRNQMLEADFKDYAALELVEQYVKRCNAKNQLVAVLEEITIQNLSHSRNPGFVDSAFVRCMAMTDDSLVQSQLSGAYHKGMAIYYGQMMSVAKTEKHVKEAYKLMPDDPDVIAILRGVLITQLGKKSVRSGVVFIKEIEEQYPFMFEDDVFINAKVIYYLLYASESFRAKNVKRGEYYLNMAMADYKRHKDALEVDTEIIAGAYNEAATAFYKAGQKSKALAMAKKGLSYSPQDSGLKQTHDFIKSRM